MKRRTTLSRETDDFTIRVGVHQSSALSPYLISIVMDELPKVV